MFSMQMWRACLTATLLLSSGATGSDESVHWRVDYDSARKEATDKSRPLFLKIQSDACIHCARMEAGPLRDPANVKLLRERFVPLVIDANRFPKLVEALRVQVYPTIIIASTDGKILAFLEGFQEAKTLHDRLLRSLAAQTPDWMARDFHEAARAIGAGDYAKAIPLLKGVLADGKGLPVQTKARSVLDEVEQQATGQMARIEQLQDRGQYAEAMDLVTDLLSRYPGTRAADAGAKLHSDLTARPELKANSSARRSAELLAQARAAFQDEQFATCLELCEILETTYQNQPTGKKGAELAAAIRASPEKLAKACASLNERLAAMYLTLAESWLQKGDKELAATCFERAVRAAPASKAAREAQAKLVFLAHKPTTITTEFQRTPKPER